jgi:geranylgeranyl pyrophosphate synthase
MERKTAYYSFLSPIELGACLAGAKAITTGLHDYSIHAGCAFQIADDIIGTFGAESETGKGTNDDIYEGKLTLLAHHAFLHGTGDQKKILNEVLGNEAATDKECDEVRAIFKTTGALEFAEKRLRVHEALALDALKSDTKTNGEFIEFLRRLGDYLVNRKA